MRRFRDLPLFWKLQLPFVLLVLIVGATGTFVVVRQLTTHAGNELDRNVYQRSVNAQAYLRDEESYVLESVRLASNLQGMPEAVATADGKAVAQFVASVAAVRTSLDLLVITDTAGTALVELRRSQNVIEAAARTVWTSGPVGEVLRGDVDRVGDKQAGFVAANQRTYLVSAGPIRKGDQLVGTAVAGIDVRAVAAAATKRVGAAVTLYETSGRTLAGNGRTPPAEAARRPVRRIEKTDGGRTATVYSPLEVRSQRVGLMSVALPAKAALAAPRGTGVRLAALLALALAAVVSIGAWLARFVLRQVVPLLDSQRRIGRGELDARAPVLGADELGELALRFNQAAEQLEAHRDEIESRVAQRTEELQRVYEELQSVYDARSQMFASISHEFRSPIFAIRAAVDLLQRALPSAKAGTREKELLVAIQSSAQDLNRLVAEVLDFARSDAGRLELQLEPVALHKVVRDLTQTIGALARSAGLQAHFDVRSSLPRVMADPVRLRQILINLLSNSVKYTPAGGHVTLSARSENGGVLVAVADTGIGIPTDVGDRIFEPFYRVTRTSDDRAATTSSGLGLALARRLVEGHGGELRYAANDEQGTTFTFDLQSVQADGPPGQTEATCDERQSA